MLFTVLGVMGGALIGVYAGLTDHSTQSHYMLVTNVAFSLGFFAGRGLDALRARR